MFQEFENISFLTISKTKRNTKKKLGRPLTFCINIYFVSIENKFLQLILISLDSASWKLHQYSC